jgi:uncharacterized RDD family membrane protein YckC
MSTPERPADLAEIWRQRPRESLRSARPGTDHSAGHRAAPAVAYGGVGRRFLALVVDGVAFYFLGIAVMLAAGADVSWSYADASEPVEPLSVTTTSDTSALWLFAILVLVLGVFWMLVWIAYFVVCEAAFGRTIGKALLGLRVLSEDGTAAGFGQVLVRNLFRIFALVYLIAAIAVWTSPRNQRIGDRVAGTVVMRSRG